MPNIKNRHSSEKKRQDEWNDQVLSNLPPILIGVCIGCLAAMVFGPPSTVQMIVIVLTTFLVLIYEALRVYADSDEEAGHDWKDRL